MTSLPAIQPSDCAMAVAVPTSRDSYLEHIAAPRHRDFVPRICPVWAKYQRELVEPFAEVLPRIQGAGVKVVVRATLKDWAALLSDGFAVVVLIAHYNSWAVEFYEGMVDIDQVVAAVPQGYEGVLDLCVCHSERLVTSLKLGRNCLVRFSSASATPSVWAYFYSVLFEVMTAQRCDYLSAVEKATRLLTGRAS